MINLILTLIFVFTGFTVQAKTIHLAIIDSGIPRFSTSLKICPNGLYDMTGSDIYDRMTHGTNISGIISDKLKDVPYCAYIFKIYNNDSQGSLLLTLRALFLLYNLDIDIVNYSSTGPDSLDVEKALIYGLINYRNVKFVAAAGNDHKDLDKYCGNFPACYPGVISVGNLNADGSIAKTSNYGKRVSEWRAGMYVRANGITMSGSSQSTAVYTADLALQLWRERSESQNASEGTFYKHSK